MTEYLAEKKQIIETCLFMQKIGFFMGTWGNVSMRSGEHILLTPSKVAYHLLLPEDIVVIDLQGVVVSGHRKPTSEKEVHRQIYLRRNDVSAIIHTHTINAMALSGADIDRVPCLTEEMSQLLGGPIPLTSKYIPAQQHAELGVEAAASIGTCNAVILRNHGAAACGSDLDQASLAAQVAEKACAIFIAATSSGRSLREIPEGSIHSEHYRYFHTYGKEDS